MVLKNLLGVLISTTLLAWSSQSRADQYRPDQFLGLDLSTAVLSPKPLGPPAKFAPVPIEARTDRSEGAQARVEPKAIHTITVHKTSVPHLRAHKPHRAIRPKLPHRPHTLLDA